MDRGDAFALDELDQVVGLALAAELGRLGVRCAIVEQTDGAVDHPRASELNARTMEICRRWGIAGKVRAAGTPSDFPNAAMFATSLTGYKLTTILRQSHRPDRDFTHGPERPKRCNQLWFDPILRDYVATHETVTLRSRCRFEGFERRGAGITATVRDLGTDTVETIAARFLVACCGGNSAIPAALGEMPDEASILDHSLNIFFRSPELWARHDKGAASLNFFLKPEGLWAGMSSQNGRDLWRVTVHGTADATARAAADPDAALERVFGGAFPYELISVKPWTRRSWVAGRYGDGDVFLVGDAAHQCSPTGGFGLNTGIGDALDIAWKLAATLAGWGGPGLLASYEAERRPVGLRNIAEATRNFEQYALPDATAIEDDTDEGRDLRARIAALIKETRSRQFLSDGIAMGYCYAESPIVCPDGTPVPPDPPSEYTPSGRPGGRAPHLWLEDGRSVLDLFGDGFTLLRLGENAPDGGSLRAAATARGMKLSIAEIANPAARALYGRRLALVRPDGHVAWRADAAPEDAAAVIDRLRGVY